MIFRFLQLAVVKKSNFNYSIVSHLMCRHIVEFTATRYPNLQRGPYREVNDEDLTYFERILSKESIITDSFDLESYNTDWLKTCRGNSSVLLRPKTTDEVSAILKYCNINHLAVCPQGGNTGLVGGSVPVFDEIIISMSLMNKVHFFDPITGIVTCHAGCVLEKLDQHVQEEGYVIPLDLGAKGSCHIGGNVATNAGGLRYIKYGSLKGNVLGLKVVLANGEILDCLSTLRKDNTGFDVKQLFIGSEGSLGIITDLSLLCPPKPKAVAVAFLGCSSFETVLSVLRTSKETLAEVLTAIEMMDAYAMDSVEKNLNIENPISSHPFYVLIEVSGSNSEHNEEKLDSLLTDLIEKGIVSYGTVALQPSHIQKIWQVRERITESLLHEGYTYKYDISLPLNSYYEIVNIMRKKLGSKITRCCGYGHLGDSNIHLNMTSPSFNPEVLKKIEPFVFDWTAKQQGSISAEHGLGFKKRNYIHYSKSIVAIELMKKFKKMLDPNGILNPYKVLPENH